MNVTRSVAAARLTFGASVAFLAACGGNDSPFVGPTPGPCSYLNAKIALISPAPGATGVPDAFPEVIIGTNTVFPNTYDAIVSGNIGGVLNVVPFNLFIPSTLPAGATPPPFPNPIYYGSTNANATFDPKSLITVALNDTGSSCVPGAPIGTFTVQ